MGSVGVQVMEKSLVGSLVELEDVFCDEELSNDEEEAVSPEEEFFVDDEDVLVVEEDESLPEEDESLPEEAWSSMSS